MTKFPKILLLFVPLCLVLFWCTHEEDYVGTYKCKHEYGEETITLYPDHSFLQIFADSNGVDSNEGRWRTESNRFVLDGWVMFKAPIQDEEIRFRLSEGEKSIFSTFIENGCIIVDDLPEFNPCKE
ncbi:MAG: hypothetical protein IJM92_08880 [Fibrobacter sp.]|uniref:hypothetical protein n=1 Tax=Fibrobacter sp. TaxID=35828 RepID=UPI0025C2CEE5|nr:hypothetical protein [Fibrobacter sp.]MBQ7079761.1 hypothetical protein [Fibrobacter sp.]